MNDVNNDPHATSFEKFLNCILMLRDRRLWKFIKPAKSFWAIRWKNDSRSCPSSCHSHCLMLDLSSYTLLSLKLSQVLSFSNILIHVVFSFASLQDSCRRTVGSKSSAKYNSIWNAETMPDHAGARRLRGRFNRWSLEWVLIPFVSLLSI